MHTFGALEEGQNQHDDDRTGTARRGGTLTRSTFSGFWTTIVAVILDRARQLQCGADVAVRVAGCGKNRAPDVWGTA